jgi:hypothetical protein
MTDAPRDRVASFLRSIPPADGKPATIAELCSEASVPEDSAAGFSDAMLAILRTFRVIAVIGEGQGHDVHVRAGSKAAHYFLRSLAEYVDRDLPVLHGWDQSRVFKSPYNGSQVLAGAQFVYLLEERRAELDREAPALENIDVAQVIIKERSGGTEVRYLTLFDAHARQYQLPGGQRRSVDASLHDTAVRELQADLPTFTFDPERDQLVELERIRVNQLTRISGVITGYDLTFYLFKTERRQLPAPPNARWVTTRDLLTSDAAVHGHPLNMLGLRELAKRTPGGLDTLAASLKPRRRRRFFAALRENP